MKTQRFIISVFALTLLFAPQLFRSATAQGKEDRKGGRYVATLISPRAGEVLTPGQVVRVEWASRLPNLDLSWCEAEVRLSLDGGKTFVWITGERDPREKFFYWTVPNTPTNEGVLVIHFGCLGHYPETASIQTQSTFVIREQN